MSADRAADAETLPDLPAFVLARIAEMAAAVGDSDFDRPHWSGCNYFAPEHMGGGECDCNYSARVLADCAAKRRIVALDQSDQLHDPDYWGATDEAVRLLAAVYADHPDYKEEWKP